MPHFITKEEVFCRSVKENRNLFLLSRYNLKTHCVLIGLALINFIKNKQHPRGLKIYQGPQHHKIQNLK